MLRMDPDSEGVLQWRCVFISFKHKNCRLWLAIVSSWGECVHSAYWWSNIFILPRPTPKKTHLSRETPSKTPVPWTRSRRSGKCFTCNLLLLLLLSAHVMTSQDEIYGIPSSERVSDRLEQEGVSQSWRVSVAWWTFFPQKNAQLWSLQQPAENGSEKGRIEGKIWSISWQ